MMSNLAMAKIISPHEEFVPLFSSRPSDFDPLRIGSKSMLTTMTSYAKRPEDRPLEKWIERRVRTTSPHRTIASWSPPGQSVEFDQWIGVTTTEISWPADINSPFLTGSLPLQTRISETRWSFDATAAVRLGPLTEFPDEPYEVREPVPVAYTYYAENDVMASFDEANIYWVAEGYEEALAGLRTEILNMLECNEAEEDQLAGHLKDQLEVLRQYVRRSG